MCASEETGAYRVDLIAHLHQLTTALAAPADDPPMLVRGTSGKYSTAKKTIALDFGEAYKERLWQETGSLLGRL